MSVKLDSLSDWNPLVGSLGLYGSDPRRVKIYFNCEAVTPFFITIDKGAPRFLTTLDHGLSTLEFWTHGEIEIAAADLEAVVHWQSTEDESQVFEGTGESFTTVHERAPRNEALEWVQYQSELNQRRMETALRAEFNNQLADIRKANEGSTSGVHGGAAPQHPQPKGGKDALKSEVPDNELGSSERAERGSDPDPAPAPAAPKGAGNNGQNGGKV
ncbi:hypothetical protein [Mesorhizobium sp. M1378]|uniref:hypothetical protein n=1 Tax=Mesorhizobium sp. M1378 TaxID=2957092 RepID=UPI00333BF627